MRRTTFQGGGTNSQGTKWFGTWERQVKWCVLPTDGQAARGSQTGGPPEHQKALTQACRLPFISEPSKAGWERS